MWRRYLVRAVLALLVLFILGFSSSTPVRPGTVAGVAIPHLYSLPGWELRNFWGKWLFGLELRFRGGTPPRQEAKAKVQEFFRLGDELGAAQADLDRATATSDQAARKRAQVRASALQSQRDVLQPYVEATLEGEIKRVLAEEGIVSRVGPWRTVWPPVDFTFTVPPFILAVSPRERIELQDTLLLSSDLSLERQESVEAGVEKLGLSAVTEQVGGVATYPSIIPRVVSLQDALNIAAHEWVHQYLFFHPLGRAYGASPEMTTVNETLADLAGREIGRLALRGLFPETAPPGPPPAPAQEQAAAPPSPETFDFSREMRVTRLAAEEMLSNGQVEAAEAYMRQRQQFLAEHGYYIRKLNQAYFAWHGTYADTPGSVSPVGGLLERFRQRSPSLGAFVREAAAVGSYEAFLEMVGQQ